MPLDRKGSSEGLYPSRTGLRQEVRAACHQRRGWKRRLPVKRQRPGSRAFHIFRLAKCGRDAQLPTLAVA